MNNLFMFGLLCFYAGLIFSVGIAIVLAWYELKAKVRRHQARRPRVMACYNPR